MYRRVLRHAIVNGIDCPSERMKRYQNQIAVNLLREGIFPSNGAFYCLYNDCGPEFARINWNDPSLYYLPTHAVPPLWVDRVGMSGRTDHDAEWYLNSGLAPSVAFTQNDGGIYAASFSGYGGQGFIAFSEVTNNVDRSDGYLIDAVPGMAINGGQKGAILLTPAQYKGLHGFYRDGSTTVRYARDGSVISSVSSPSVPPSTNPFAFLGLPNSAIGVYNSSTIACNLPLAALYIGPALTPTHQNNMRATIQLLVDRFLYVENIFASGNYTVPAGITELLVECWGGGGAGLGYPNVPQSTTGGGGGGGAYSASVVSVTPGDVIPVVIGAGGVSTGGAGSDGGDTSWNFGAIVAKGGQGAGVTVTTAALGGQASGGIGTTKFSGGNGGKGGTSLNYSTGGGGSAAGAISDGFVGLDGVNGQAFASRSPIALLGAGNPGVSGANNINGNGAPGSFGSGGGGTRRTSAIRNGGAGGGGYIRVSKINNN
jgi:hypothetical protein